MGGAWDSIPADKEAEHTVATAKDAAERNDHERAALRSMIDSYKRARTDQQKFIDRVSNTDRRGAIARPRLRRVRIAASAEARHRSPDAQ